MFATPPRAPAERLAGILDMLCRAVADHGGRKLLAVPLVLLVWGRLRRLSTRILRLAAKIEAGTPPPRPRGPRAPRPGRPKPPLILPRGKSWLIRLMRMEAAAAGSQLQHLLAEPEMQALAADPRMGRLLRPLCHALGVTPPPEIAKPARQAAPAPAATGTAQPRPVPTHAAAPPAHTNPPSPGSSCPRRRTPRGTRRALPSHGPPPAAA